MDRYRDRRPLDHDQGFPPRDGPPAPMDNREPPRRHSRSPLRGPSDAWRGRSGPSEPPRYAPRSNEYARYDAPPHHREFVPAYDAPAARGRSPPYSRTRDYSPPGRRNSPPPMKRDWAREPSRDYVRPRSPPRRTYSPPHEYRRSPPPPPPAAARAAYRPRSRSPLPRTERPDPYAAKSWRRRTPSPPRSTRGDRVGGEGPGSVTTSRRSSPPGHARKALGGPYEPADTRAGAHVVHQQAYPQSAAPPVRRRDSPPPVLRPRSPAYRQGPPNYNAPPPEVDSRAYSRNGNDYSSREAGPPTGASNYPRGPPTGPGGYRGAQAIVSPPPVSSHIEDRASMDAHNRPSSIVPTHPSGGYRGRSGPPGGGYSRDYGQAVRRESSGWSNGGGYGRGGGGGPPPSREPYQSGRGGFHPYERSHTSEEHFNGPAGGNTGGQAFRSNNSTSTTYPRTQRFNNILNELPQVKEGGERLPPLHDSSKAERLEEEAARLRKLIDEKEARKRQGLRDWDRLEREAGTAVLKSELAEEHLRELTGEGEGTAAAF